MKEMRERDTRFKGAQEITGPTNKSADRADAANDVHLHNYLDVIFNARINLSKLSKKLSPKKTN